MLTADQLKHSGIAHGFFTRGGGHSTGIFASLNCGLGSGDDSEVVQKNRDIVARQLGIAAPNLVTAWQVHGTDVAHVTKPWDISNRPKVDAMVCATPGIALGILTADCGPILFADPEAGVIGAAHAGWKGALAGVAATTVSTMETLGARRTHMTAVIGPTISQANYEVGPDFPKPFLAADPHAQKFFKSSVKKDHYMFDLPAYLVAQMEQLGIAEVVNLGPCTYQDEARFFSYRRATHRGETDYGRLVSAIALR
jgi:polyphenol oxidase